MDVLPAIDVAREQMHNEGTREGDTDVLEGDQSLGALPAAVCATALESQDPSNEEDCGKLPAPTTPPTKSSIVDLNQPSPWRKEKVLEVV